MLEFNVSIFAQILQLFSVNDFAKAVNDTGAEANAKGFSSRDQFVAMLFCQLGKANSLREICGGLASCFGKLNHLGLKQAPSRSTLSYANNTRPWQLYEQMFFQLLDKCEQLTANNRIKFKFKNKLYSMDATIIDLCLSMYDWAKFKSTKGAVKMHMILDHDGYLPVFVNITEGNVHEINAAWEVSFPKGSIVAVDRGYTDYALFAKWTREKVFFVTRQKDNAKYSVAEEYKVIEGSGILKDELISLDGYGSQCLDNLRRIEVWSEEKQQIITLLTNHPSLSPVTIAAIYKERWQIELFFKALKQLFKIKTFVGTSKNALLTQLWTALIAILALKYLQLRSKYKWSLSNLVAMMRFNLFVYRDLWEWLDDPYRQPSKQETEQLILAY